MRAVTHLLEASRALIAGLALLAGPAMPADPPFVRGDINRDGEVNLVDASYYFDARYLGAPPPSCVDAADVNDSGAIEFATDADLYFLLDWLFKATSPSTLPAPFPFPGADPTADGLACADAGVTPPGDPHKGYAMDWDTAPGVQPGQKDVASFLLATTAGPIECFSIAFRIDKKYVENVRVDLQGTIFPTALRAKFESSPAFRWRVVPSKQPAKYDLLLVGAIFVLDPTMPLPAGDGGGGAFQRIPFAATTGPLEDAPLLRVVADVKAGAPKGGPFTVLFPAPDEDFVTAGDAVHGLGNDFGGFNPARIGVWFIPHFVGEMRWVIGGGEEFLFRGDSNRDLKVDISDPSHSLNFLFLGGPEPPCLDAADANDDGEVDVSDPVMTLLYLFDDSVASLPAPGADRCGLDVTLDVLGCLGGGCGGG
ncbi:MAG: hypothetical protein HY721_07790 [Planctomycetes bacterium]|nr:hypothetical protein [Planctomycetota bacterium]